MYKNKGTLFSPTLKVGEKEVGLVFQNSAYWPRYYRFEVSGTLH